MYNFKHSSTRSGVLIDQSCLLRDFGHAPSFLIEISSQIAEICSDKGQFAHHIHNLTDCAAKMGDSG